MTAQMSAADVFDMIPDKIDTLLAAGAAVGLGWQNYRLKRSQARSAEIDPINQQVDIIHKVGEDLRTDLARIRQELAECEKGKMEMRADLKVQGQKISDLTELFARNMEAQGMPRPIKRPHRDDLTGA
jgi:hypothetical protein